MSLFSKKPPASTAPSKPSEAAHDLLSAIHEFKTEIVAANSKLVANLDRILVGMKHGQ